jgi:hypothetical protein
LSRLSLLYKRIQLVGLRGARDCAPRGLFAQLLLNPFPEVVLEDRLVQSQMAFPLVADLADIDRVGELWLLKTPKAPESLDLELERSSPCAISHTPVRETEIRTPNLALNVRRNQIPRVSLANEG